MSGKLHPETKREYKERKRQERGKVEALTHAFIIHTERIKVALKGGNDGKQGS